MEVQVRGQTLDPDMLGFYDSWEIQAAVRGARTHGVVRAPLRTPEGGPSIRENSLHNTEGESRTLTTAAAM